MRLRFGACVGFRARLCRTKRKLFRTIPQSAGVFGAQGLEQRPQRAAVCRRRLSYVLPVQLRRAHGRNFQRLGQYELGPRHEHRPRPLAGTARRHSRLSDGGRRILRDDVFGQRRIRRIQLVGTVRNRPRRKSGGRPGHSGAFNPAAGRRSAPDTGVQQGRRQQLYYLWRGHRAEQPRRRGRQRIPRPQGVLERGTFLLAHGRRRRFGAHVFLKEPQKMGIHRRHGAVGRMSRYIALRNGRRREVCADYLARRQGEKPRI